MCCFWYPKVKYKFVQAHVYAVFGIQKSNICLYKLMYVLFLLSKSQIYACVQVHVCAVFVCKAMEHDKQAEKDYEEEEENGEDEDEQGTLFEEEEDSSYFAVKALSVMLCKIALFGCQRSIFFAV